ncbi:uncharacterized protein MELLADRAFT_103102 [Melampsora larici-populina 98AG31]|uniref:Uncharacterized protein n=1 Tax=Melampsora larici-populina (strain 98AG31 / pathotype 3-4-7) TaxID=747676 RepID=F4RAJ8_MELLP|nr:uncharacterized protein MELLADRAFT_103102 [Melampsora larici-populina 98AG31]EGG10770.1 hypothetical protein MELLADRAFT_103102 [Melampsora larici-populina 98AG31]
MPYEPIQNLIHEDKNADEVFDPPYLIADGDDAPARHPTLKRLWRQGTESRRLMEESQSFTIGVAFKIHTNDIVEVTPGMVKASSTSKVTAAKKRAPPPLKYAIINSADFKDGQVLDFKVFLYGKSLKEFKGLVGDICDRYFIGIKKVVLKSALTPLLNWNASVGSKKTKLTDFKSYQEFVVHLGKSRSSKGLINITLEKPQIKAKKNAQRDGITSRGIPPNTTEYNMSVDNRVKRRYPNPSPSVNVSSSRQRQQRNFFANPPADEVKVKQEPISPSTSRRTLEASSSRTRVTAPKKVKLEESSGMTPGKSISLLTDEEVPKSEPYVSNSDVEFVVTHATLLDDFLLECDVPRTDLATRSVLRKAQVTSWTDLIPSVQMTANVLTGHGMPFQLASRLIEAVEEANAQYEYLPH